MSYQESKFVRNAVDAIKADNAKSFKENIQKALLEKIKNRIGDKKQTMAKELFRR